MLYQLIVGSHTITEHHFIEHIQNLWNELKLVLWLICVVIETGEHHFHIIKRFHQDLLRHMFIEDIRWLLNYLIIVVVCHYGWNINNKMDKSLLIKLNLQKLYESLPSKGINHTLTRCNSKGFSIQILIICIYMEIWLYNYNNLTKLLW